MQHFPTYAFITGKLSARRNWVWVRGHVMMRALREEEREIMFFFNLRFLFLVGVTLIVLREIPPSVTAFALDTSRAFSGSVWVRDRTFYVN